MLVIRMRQQGANNRQTYRLVVTDERSPRDGKYLEMLGWYNPFAKEDAQLAKIDAERLQYWLDLGAAVSDRVKSLVKKFAPDVAKQMSAKKVARRDKTRLKRQK